MYKMCLYIIINILSNSCCGILGAVVLGSCWTGSWGVPCRGAGAVSPSLGTSGLPVPAGVVATEPRGTDLLLSPRPFMVTPPWPRTQAGAVHHNLREEDSVPAFKTQLEETKQTASPPCAQFKTTAALRPPTHLTSPAGAPPRPAGGTLPGSSWPCPARPPARSSWPGPPAAAPAAPGSSRPAPAAPAPPGTPRVVPHPAGNAPAARPCAGCARAAAGRSFWGGGEGLSGELAGSRGVPSMHPPRMAGAPGRRDAGGGCTSAPSWAAGSAAPLHMCSEHGGFSVWDEKSEMGGLTRG